MSRAADLTPSIFLKYLGAKEAKRLAVDEIQKIESRTTREIDGPIKIYPTGGPNMAVTYQMVLVLLSIGVSAAFGLRYSIAHGAGADIGRA